MAILICVTCFNDFSAYMYFEHYLVGTGIHHVPGIMVQSDTSDYHIYLEYFITVSIRHQ